MSNSVLMTRSKVAEYLGISKRQVIRIEKDGKLSGIKLCDSPKGIVYYKRAEVENLIKQGQN